MTTGVARAPNILMLECNLSKPHFEYLGMVRATSNYRKNVLVENPYVTHWMDNESISTGEYSYTRGTTRTVYKGTAKYAFEEPRWNQIAFSKAWQMVTHRWSVVTKAGLATEFEDWIDMTTSPGYPYNIIFKDKREVAQDQETMGYMKMCFEQSYCNGLWSVRCKTEPTKQKKLAEDNGRVIVSAPMDVQVAGVRLFAPMNNRIYQAARQHKIPCTVGLTKFYRGWHHLYNRLTRWGKFKQGLELDYTNYDGTCTLQEFEQLMNMRFGLLRAELQTPEMKAAFRRYYQEVVFTKMVLDGGEVVMKFSGNPSGQINTIVDNSIINEFRWYYAWCMLTPEEMHSIRSFSQYCELLTCGDDSVLSVSDDVPGLFTPQQVFDIFKEHGWNPKFGMDGWQPIHKLNYCSQSFKWMNGWVVPVPNNYQKMLASLKWGGQRRDPRETLGRLLGIKIESYFLSGFRASLDHLISELFEKYYLNLKQTPRNLDEFTFEELCILNRDYSAAYGLYLGVEPDEVEHVWKGPVKFFTNEHLNDCL